MDRQKRTHCMASRLTRFESFWIFTFGDNPKRTLVYASPVENEEALRMFVRPSTT
jgi:hypothetical protein